jgi:hypothetical protein
MVYCAKGSSFSRPKRPTRLVTDRPDFSERETLYQPQYGRMSC